MEKAEPYETIIVGGGICGFSAAMYAGRLGLKTLIIEGEALGGTITTTNIVENWPGIKKISGEELADKVIEHAKEYKIDIAQSWVKKIKKAKKGCFEVITEDNNYDARTLIIATGAEHKKHPAKGAAIYENRGVHYCALCDGPLYSGKELAVVGGGDSAVKEALLLTKFASKVHLLVRGSQLRGEAVNNERAKNNKKIIIDTDVEVVEMMGDKKLESLKLKRDDASEELRVDGAFIAIGTAPRSEVVKEIGVKLNEKREIIMNRRSETNVKGVYACGDVTDTRFKQAITGAGEAVAAAYWAYSYLKDSEYVCPHGE